MGGLLVCYVGGYTLYGKAIALQGHFYGALYQQTQQTYFGEKSLRNQLLNW